MNKHRHESVSITVTSWICNNSWTTGWSDRIECLGFSDHRSDYQFWATNKVRSPSPIWSYQFLKSFRSPIWSDRITDHRNLHIPQLANHTQYHTHHYDNASVHTKLYSIQSVPKIPHTILAKTYGLCDPVCVRVMVLGLEFGLTKFQLCS